MGHPRSWLEEAQARNQVPKGEPVDVTAFGYAEGIPFLETRNGLRFHGLPGNSAWVPTQRQNPLWKQLPADAFAILADIENRYFKDKQHRRYAYRPGDVVVELGAYLGYYSMHTARAVGASGRVVTVEFMPDNHHLLSLNLARNFPNHTTALGVGVWKETGSQTVFVGGGQRNGFRREVIARGGGPVDEIEIPTETIDNILDSAGVDHVDLLIVQINGVELEALRAVSRWERIDHLAIAANYDDADEKAPVAIADHLDACGFATEVFNRWVYAKRWPGTPRRQRPPEQGPIFVGGCGRSGTTLLRVMLDSHRNIACGPESNALIEPDKVSLSRLAEKFDMPTTDVVRLADESAYLPDFVDRFFTRYAARSQKGRWAEKSPRNVRQVEYLFDNFPDAHFVHVVRDGRDVACSLRTHPKYKRVDGAWVENDVRHPFDECIQRWLDDTAEGLRWRGHPRYHEVHYEDLVRSPEATMKQLLGELGEAWDPAVLRYYEQKTASRDASRFPQNRRATEPIQVSSLERWRRDMSAEERTLFKEMAGALLVRCGYEAGLDW